MTSPACRLRIGNTRLLVAMRYIPLLAVFVSACSCTRTDPVSKRCTGDGASENMKHAHLVTIDFVQVEIVTAITELMRITGSDGLAFKAPPGDWLSEDPWDGNEIFVQEVLKLNSDSTSRKMCESHSRVVEGRQLLIDYWGTPFYFGTLSFSKLVFVDATTRNRAKEAAQVRSAGPNRRFGDDDDLIFVSK